MSADDAIFIQQSTSGLWAAQWGFMSDDFLPNPNKARPGELYNTLEIALECVADRANDTEYGLRIIRPKKTCVFEQMPKDRSGVVQCEVSGCEVRRVALGDGWSLSNDPPVADCKTCKLD